MREPLWKPGFQHSGAKYNSTLHHLPTPSPSSGTAYFCTKIDLFGLTSLDWGKGEPVSVCLASAAVCDAAKEAHFRISPSRVLSHELNGWGWEEAGRVTDKILGWEG